MVNFKAGDTWETIFSLETRAARKKKSYPPVLLLKQLFLKIIILHQKRRYQSDPGFINGQLLFDQVRYDPRSYERNLRNCVYRSLKILDLNLFWTSDVAIAVRRPNQLSYEATGTEFD